MTFGTILRDFVDAGFYQIARFLNENRRNLSNHISAQALWRVAASTSRSLRGWVNLVVDALRHPFGFRLEVKRRPVWMHISAALFVALLAWFFIPNKSAASSGPPVTAVGPPVATVDPTVATVANYEPRDSGVVAEICFLVREISEQKGRGVGAQTLYDFVESEGRSGVVRSDSLSLQRLCGACLTSEVRLSEIMKSKGEDESLERVEDEVEGRRRILDRSIILLSDRRSVEIYESLLIDGRDSEKYEQTKKRTNSLCQQFWS